MARRPRVGLVVNPIAGIGGAVGLKGSDGADIVRLARDRGAVPHAGERATAALEALARRWPAGAGSFELLVGPGPMGEESARAAGLAGDIVGPPIVDRPTTADDTLRLVRVLADAPVDLLLVAGGDGTARDAVAALAGRTGPPVLGIPAGVKIQSAAFATSPRAAGEIAAAFVSASEARRRTALREVLDLDEAAYRRGEVAPRLYGELPVPVDGRRLQSRKEATPRSEAAAVASIAAEIASNLVRGRRYILGPGSTIRAIADRLGVEKTLVGVDVVDAVGPESARLVAQDVAERDLLGFAAARDATIVVTPIGGQGFILGRGNQQLGPSVVRDVLASQGRSGIIVVATLAKMAGLGGRPLLVDTGDPGLDAELTGHVRVVTGLGEATIYPVAAA
ncbi:MAG TPA: ATP-NAD kinase family protein [Candidatus Limnocylindrales bacterium]